MIRRNLETPEGQRWLLLPQAEHARVAGVLAEHWDGLLASEPDTRQRLLSAIYRHDDGWNDWEATPGVDTITGRPLDFTEMPTAAALQIWSQSVDCAQSLGPLEAWVTSAHFCRMLQKTGENDQQLVEGFLRVQQAKQATWLSAWRGAAAAERTERLAELCLEILQAFDALSLWICCGRRHEPYQFQPTGTDLATLLRPRSDDCFGVVPWPFTTPTVSIEVVGRSIPVDRYSDGADVATRGTPDRLAWQFTTVAVS